MYEKYVKESHILVYHNDVNSSLVENSRDHMQIAFSYLSNTFLTKYKKRVKVSHAIKTRISITSWWKIFSVRKKKLNYLTNDQSKGMVIVACKYGQCITFIWKCN